MVRIAHLSDIHVPIWRKAKWLERWNDIAHEVQSHKPDAIVITGDIQTSAWPAPRAKDPLKCFVKEPPPTPLGTADRIYVPGNHDVNTSHGLGRRGQLAASVFEQITEFK